MIYRVNNNLVKQKWMTYRITILYVFFSSIYILISDSLLFKWPRFSELTPLFELSFFKALFFIFISSFILQIVIGLDRKQHMLSRKQLQENQRILYELINNLPDIVCLKDGEGRWLEANTATLQIFEIEDIHYKGKTNSELASLCKHTHNGFAICSDSDKRAWEAGKAIRCEEVFGTKEDFPKVYDVIKVPIVDSDGNRQMLVVTARDITERKIMENKLRESEQRYESLYNAISGGIILRDREGTVLHANEEAGKILGTKLEEMCFLLSWMLLS